MIARARSDDPRPPFIQEEGSGSPRSRHYYEGKEGPAQVQVRGERKGWSDENGRIDRSADRDHGREPIAREQLERAVQGKLSRVMRRDLPPEHELTLHFLDRQILDPAVGGLANSGFDLLDQ